jgi:hypothetical protein
VITTDLLYRLLLRKNYAEFTLYGNMSFDGSIWSTWNTFYRAEHEFKLSVEKEREILAFIAQKCGKEIERYDFLSKGED